MHGVVAMENYQQCDPTPRQQEHAVLRRIVQLKLAWCGRVGSNPTGLTTRGADEWRLDARTQVGAAGQEDGAVEGKHADGPEPHEHEGNALDGVMLLASEAPLGAAHAEVEAQIVLRRDAGPVAAVVFVLDTVTTQVWGVSAFRWTWAWGAWRWRRAWEWARAWA